MVQGNLIGTNAAGTAGVGNSKQGVWIDGSAANNTIGGTAAGAGNTIAYNGWDGVALGGTAGTGNAILGNDIYANGHPGIDLGDDGVTTNDVGDIDGGPNARMNYPVLTDVTWSSTDVTIDGTLNSAASTTYRIEFFANTTVDSTGYGEGETYLGFVDVTTNGSGDGTFSKNLTVAVPAGASYTATATDPAGNTSEFSLSYGMVAHYRLNEGGGITAVDSSGRGLDGTHFASVGYTGGVSGTAGDYTAADDFTRVADNDDLDMGLGDFSISLWFNTAQTFTWENPMLARKVVGGDGYELFLWDNSGYIELEFKFWEGGGNNHVRTSDAAVTPPAVNDGQWHHVVGVKNGAQIELYLDGAFIGSSAGPVGSLDNNEPLYFGGHDGDADNLGDSWANYDGLIDEISIYNRAIGAAEAADLASAPLVVDITETLVAPTIDGTVDAAWSSALAHDISIISGTVTDANDLSGTWRSLWDSTNLYYLVEVTDDLLFNDSGLQPWFKTTP